MLEFAKYHGAGNDFVILDRRHGALPEPLSDLAVRVCHRRFGVGADGILVVGDSDGAGGDASMHIQNSDGSYAEMCGNGLRCVVKYLLDDDPARDEITIQTGAGPLACRAERGADGHVSRVRVDMGRPILERTAIPLAGEGTGLREEIQHPEGRTFAFTGVSMGNPHAIVFVDEGEPAALARRWGPGLETLARFPKKANVSFVRPQADRLVAAVWERGAGLTAACGTGACAIGVAAVLEERAAPETPITVALPGGDLVVEVAPGHARVFMTGPAERVYAGALDLDRIPDVATCEALTRLMGL